MENNDLEIGKITDSLEKAITGIPAPIRKNFLKAFGQLCTAAVDIPVAWLEGKSAEIRTTTEARIKIINKEGENISEQVNVPKEYILRASTKYAAKIIKEQLNLDQITLNAAKELSGNNQKLEDSSGEEEISGDWLNEFENIARLKSSDEMKVAFGKILAGEIKKPGSFSIRTIKLISQLDNHAAILFQLFCSQVISLRIGNKIIDARVVSFNGSAAINTLSNYGLSFDKLNILQEYGLIIAEYNSWMGYSPCITNEKNRTQAAMYYQNKKYGLVPIDREKYDKELKLYGVALTNSGKELLDIITIQQTDNYKNDLIEYFKNNHPELHELKS